MREDSSDDSASEVDTNELDSLSSLSVHESMNTPVSGLNVACSKLTLGIS